MTNKSDVTDEHVDEQQMVRLPRIYASNFQAMISGVDLTILVGQAAPYLSKNPLGEDNAIAVAILQMGLHAAKDLHALLGEGLRQYEAEFGELNTPFTKQLAQK